MADGRMISDSRSTGRPIKQAAIADSASDSGLGLTRPPRPKSVLPPFAIPDHG
jgi:hypothetical protein